MIGDALIPRAAHDDSRFQGVDLAARGHSYSAWLTGIDRLTLNPDDLSPELKRRVAEIARELRRAGPEEVGRWATDTLYAYSEAGVMTEDVEAACYLIWRDAAWPDEMS